MKEMRDSLTLLHKNDSHYAGAKSMQMNPLFISLWIIQVFALLFGCRELSKNHKEVAANAGVYWPAERRDDPALPGDKDSFMAVVWTYETGVFHCDWPAWRGVQHVWRWCLSKTNCSDAQRRTESNQKKRSLLVLECRVWATHLLLLY